MYDAGKFLGVEISAEKDIVLVFVRYRITNEGINAIDKERHIDILGNDSCFTIDGDKVTGRTNIHQ